MKRIILSAFLLFVLSNSYAQDPSIENGFGLGQYGYLEYDSSNSSTKAYLNRGSHTDVKSLGARWWVDDNNGNTKDFTYWTSGIFNCNTHSNQIKATADYVTSDFGDAWKVGSNCYVSVKGKRCNDVEYPSYPYYNQIQFQVIDIENAPFAGIKNTVSDGDGSCTADHLVASFTIDVGTLSDKYLKRFWFENKGSAQEGTDIPNNGFKVFYEPATGSETFDTNEDSFEVLGNNNNNPNDNNIYGSDDINVLLSGKTRFYVALCNTNGDLGDKTVKLHSINDAFSISSSGLENNNHGLVRVGALNISQSTPLPVNLVDFSAKEKNKSVELTWITTNEFNNSKYQIYHSSDFEHWRLIGEIDAKNRVGENSYNFVDKYPKFGKNYYKISQIDNDGTINQFEPVFIEIGTRHDINISPNPVKTYIEVSTIIEDFGMSIFDVNGSEVLKESNIKNNILDVSSLKNGLYQAVFFDKEGRMISVKKFIKI